MDFAFNEFYNFVITVLGMILSYKAGRSSSHKTKK